MEFKETAKAIKDESKYLDTAAEEQIKNPLYWGEQPMTQGPVYIGSIVFLLFFLGLIIINDRSYKKFTLLIYFRLAFIWVNNSSLVILLSWGHNLGWLSHLFFDYFPLYSKS